MSNYTQIEQDNITNIETQLANFGVGARVENISTGPVITRYELSLNAGVRVSRVQGLEADLAMALRTTSIRLQTPIPGTSYIGIEIPNARRDIVDMASVVPAMEDFDGELDVVLGKDTVGQPVVLDLAKTPHMLVAGQTGSGKSVMVNTLISSLLMKKSPEDVRMIMVDPKVVELIQYKDVPHLLHPIITEADEALSALEWTVNEMEERYLQLADAGVRNIKSFNERTGARMPYIVFIIDEMADLMLSAGRKAEEYIQRITQKARAVGIHMVLATQRPSVDVVTGTIKANVPARIAFKVASHIDSSTIIGQKGAEQLLGRGDMLVQSNGDAPQRVHGAYMSDEEIENLVNDLPVYAAEHISFEDDEPAAATSYSIADLYLEAVEIANKYEMISLKMIIKRLKVSRAKAEMVLKKLISDGIVRDSESNYKPLIIT